MAQHYSLICHDVYELKMTGKFFKRRKFKEMIKLFKPLNWILFLIMILVIYHKNRKSSQFRL